MIKAKKTIDGFFPLLMIMYARKHKTPAILNIKLIRRSPRFLINNYMDLIHKYCIIKYCLSQPYFLFYHYHILTLFA